MKKCYKGSYVKTIRSLTVYLLISSHAIPGYSASEAYPAAPYTQRQAIVDRMFLEMPDAQKRSIALQVPPDRLTANFEDMANRLFIINQPTLSA
jgi:hypothetical protein